MSDTESAGGGEGVAGAEASGAGASGAGAVCPADQPNISVTMDEPVGLTKETLDSLKFADQDPQEYDPIRVGMATNDLDLDEVNDNLPDFAAEDNLSLEVNFGDGSSCRASDVSSLSFQNIALDDPSEGENVEIFFRRDSLSDSSDSPLNEYGGQEACGVFTGRFEDELKRREDGVEGDEGRPEQDLEQDFEEGEDDSYSTGTMKRRSKMSVASSESDQTNTACSDNKHCDSGGSGGGGGCSARFTNNLSNLPQNANDSHHALQETSTTASQSKDTNAAGNESEATASNSEAGGDSSMHDSLSSHQGAEQSNSDKSLSMAESRDCETLSNHSADVLSHVSKRNSLEVRNNIPDVAEVKSYSDDSSDDIIKYQGQGAIPKIIKKSPGLARRLVERTVPDNRDSSSSEREMDLSQPPFDNTIISAQKDFETKLRNGTYSPRTKPHVGSSRNSMEPPSTDEEHYDNVVPPSVEHKEREQENGLDARAEVNKDVDGLDVLNEYDYVKYARIQHGDSYVGMRLAYSSSNDSLVFRDRPAGVNRVRSSDDEHYISSSREGSPEKVMQRPRNHLPETMRVSNVNEETLTEIPLNGNEGLPNETERRNFSLSPEATDCDSAEVESVLSEEGKSSTSGMPIVEDGLSSSQGSDTEDTSTQDVQRPAEILKRRHKAEIEQELQNKLHDRMLEDSAMSSVTDNSSELSTPSHDNGAHRIQREALDLAIKDIQSAIQRSKSMTLKSPSGDANGEKEEPVWVMRDSYVRKLQKQDDVRKAHKEYEKQREEEYTTKEQEHVYQVEDEGEGLMKYQYTHNDGKVYQTTRGFDSDDDYQDSERHQSTRRNIRHVKGKKYASLPADDPVDAAYFRVRNVYYPPNYSRYASRVDRDGMKHGDSNSDSERHYVTNQDLHDHDAVPRPSSHAHNFSSTISQSRYRTENNGESLNTSSSTSEQYSSASRTSDDSQSSPSLYGANNYSSPSSRDSHQGPPLASRETYRIPEDSEEEEYIEEVFHKPSAYIRQRGEGGEYDTDEETDELLDKQYVRPDQVDIPELSRPPINRSAQAEKRRSRAREVALRDPDNETVLIEGVLFRARYLGSTQLISEGQPSKAMRMMQAQEAVGRIKAMGKIHFGDKYQAPEGESQPSTEVDLFISTEKLMVLNTDLQEIMMDHSLRTISYIADIGDVLVLMARRGPVTSPMQDGMIRKRQSKICCHVFDTEEAQLIAQSIGQAFQVAYMEFLKANGIEDPGLMKEMDYQEVLNQQEIFGEELYLFANKEMQKEVIVPKLKGELLGIVIVESGWGSMVPTVVLANMSPTGAAARCGQLNIGDQIMSINGVSLVGLPLSSCQTYIKAAKNQTVVKLTVVSCPPVVEVCIKRPDVKYQLGFSVQNGVICSLLRGGIAERGGVRVGHRIIEINSQSVVAVAHDKIVNMLATSVGEIHMKTMPTSIYRLLTGQDTPHYM